VTHGDLVRIERALAIALPLQLRELYTHYPFARDSWAACCAMPDDAELLISWNTVDSAAETFGLLPDEVFQIGSDGRTRLYFVTLRRPENAVLEADLATGTIDDHTPDLLSWVMSLHAEHDSMDRDQQSIRS
jgi:hypothetical protein